MNLMKQLGEILTKDHSESHYMRFATSWTWTNFLHQTKKEPVGMSRFNCVGCTIMNNMSRFNCVGCTIMVLSSLF